MRAGGKAAEATAASVEEGDAIDGMEAARSKLQTGHPGVVFLAVPALNCTPNYAGPRSSSPHPKHHQFLIIFRVTHMILLIKTILSIFIYMLY